MSNSCLVYQIIATLAYSNQFHWPLSFDEIYKRLISVQLAEQLVNRHEKQELINEPSISIKNKSVEQRDLQNKESLKNSLRMVLNELLDKNIVVEADDQFFLRSALTSKQSLLKLVAKKKNSLELAKTFRLELNQVKNELEKISWIKAAGVTGSLAVGHAQAHDDIDFIIITKDKRLWLSRLRLLVQSIIKGKKSFIFFVKENRWCFNLWLESSALSLTDFRQSIYGAYEVNQIDWFYDPDELSQVFFHKNQWMEKYLLSYVLVDSDKIKLIKGSLNKDADKKNLSLRIGSKFLDVLNKLVYVLQKRYILKKTNVSLKNLSLAQAFFHDDVSYKKIIQEWERLFRLSSEKFVEIESN